MRRTLGLWLAYLTLAIAMVLGSTFGAYTAVQKLAGLSVAQAQGATVWNNLLDAGLNADSNTRGLAAVGLQGFDGLIWNAIRSDPVDGLTIDLRTISGNVGGLGITPSDGFTNPTNAIATSALSSHLRRFPSPSTWERRLGLNGTPSAVTVHNSTSQKGHVESAADTEVTITFAAVADLNRYLHKVAAFCSAGTSTLTIESPSATVIWSTDTGGIGTAYEEINFPVGIGTAVNTAIVIRLATCGAGNTGTVMAYGSSL